MHLSIIFKTTSEKIKTLSRISNALDEKQVKLLYSPFIMSQFNYCSITWIFCSKTSYKKIEQIQKNRFTTWPTKYTAVYVTFEGQNQEASFQKT